ncbi:hypothetical protein J5N97_026856 [Dioscorea zingiberensis]|uniref:BHLH domain-containing protein n=1 Tax=Dioscorea zingiberensis TaxID=325984 RepID=A0A9D5H741_9LILI|nr:hypothetical protein J5N97_026856 [Dioscorea zingiberensis]
MRRRPVSSVRRRLRRMVSLREKKCNTGLVLKKLKKLKKIIPGCGDSGVETLLCRTAEYIFILEMQVNVLKSLSDLYGV